MTGPKMPPKRKSQGRFKDLDDDSDQNLPSGVGHVEQHTTYRHRQQLDTVDTESSLYHLPPSPVKKARTFEAPPVEDVEDTEPPPLIPLEFDLEDGVWTESDGNPQRGVFPSVRMFPCFFYKALT